MKTNDARSRLGVFERYESIPPQYRLENYEARYADTEPFRAYIERAYADVSERGFKKADRARRRWVEHVQERTDAIHPALARPEHVESYFEWLIERSPGPPHTGMSAKNAALVYSPPLAGFYDELAFSSDHPHAFSSVQMAFADENNEYARKVWRARIARNNGAANGD